MITSLKCKFSTILCVCVCVLFSVVSFAENVAFTIEIKDHKFFPAELIVPAGKKIKLTIKNQDNTPEEFESYDLNREKVVAANSSIIVFVGPLKQGRYKYFGEFNQKTAQGLIIAQ